MYGRSRDDDRERTGELDRLATEESYDRFILALPSVFLEMLRRAMSERALKKVRGQIVQDLTSENEETLPAYLSEVLALQGIVPVNTLQDA